MNLLTRKQSSLIVLHMLIPVLMFLILAEGIILLKIIQLNLMTRKAELLYIIHGIG
jgi:hypothetical protein